MSLTGHWIDKHFCRKKAVLYVQGISGSHTGQNILDVLTAITANLPGTRSILTLDCEKPLPG